MELFIPSLIVLVLAALVCFFILPKMSPYTLGALAIAMFGLGVWQHYSMFPYEYRTSMVTDLIKQYSGFIMILAVIIGGIIGVMMMHGGNPPSVVANIMPDIGAITGASNTSSSNSSNKKSLFNLNGSNNSKANTGVLGAMTNAVKNVVTNNSKKNNLASTSFKTV